MQKKSNPAALLPIFVFLVLYLGLGLVFEYVLKIPMGFYSIPIVVIFLIALLVACCQNHTLSFDEKLVLMGKGIGDKNIVTMLLIFLAAGMFVGVVGRSSAESVAYFMLSLIPAKLAVAVLFVVSCFEWARASVPSRSSRPLPFPSPQPAVTPCRCASRPSWAAPCSATT